MDFVKLRLFLRREGAECAEDSAGSGSSNQLITQHYSPGSSLSKTRHPELRFAFAHGEDYAKDVARISSSFHWTSSLHSADGFLRS